MPPKGKSKALAQKHSYLGKFTQNARNLEQMKLLIENQEKDRVELEQKIIANKSVIKAKQTELKKSMRKLAHKSEKMKLIQNQLKTFSTMPRYAQKNRPSQYHLMSKTNGRKNQQVLQLH